MSVTIAKWGNSAALRLPKGTLEAADLHIGDKVDIVQRGNTLVIEPCKLDLEELLSLITDDNQHQDLLPEQRGSELL